MSSVSTSGVYRLTDWMPICACGHIPSALRNNNNFKGLSVYSDKNGDNYGLHGKECL